MSVKMETITNKETGAIQFLNRGTDIGKDVTEQLKSERLPETSAISLGDLKSIVAACATYDDFVAAIEAL